MHNVRLYVGSLQGLYGGFLKWGDLQIIHLIGIFHYKPSILGYPIYGNPPIYNIREYPKTYLAFTMQQYIRYLQ